MIFTFSIILTIDVMIVKIFLIMIQSMMILIILLIRIQESVDCNNNINIALKQIPSQAALYTDGCVGELTKLLDDHLIYILGAVGGLALLQLLGMMFSLCLCCAVKRIEDMKA